MSASTSRLHDSTLPPGLSDTEPPEEQKRQIMTLYRDPEQSYNRRQRDGRSDDERARLKEDHKLEIKWIRALGAGEYHTPLELEPQQRKWALGEPIDTKWKDALMREHPKGFESYKPAETRWKLPQRPITYNPALLPPEIEQKKALQAREDRPAAKEEHHLAVYLPNARFKEEEARITEEEAGRRREDVKKELDVRRRRRKEEEARRKEEAIRQKEEGARVKEEEARIKQEEDIRKEEDTKKREDEVKKKELDARRKEREANRKEQEAKRKEQETKRLEEEARREEEALKRADEIRKKTEEMGRREDELKRREEELFRREAESRFEAEKLRLFEEEVERQRKEEVRRQEEEEAREIRRREKELNRQEEASRLEDKARRREEPTEHREDLQPTVAKRKDVRMREHRKIVNTSRRSVDRSPTFERSEDDRPSTRAGERPTRAGTERYAPSSPVKYEIWKPNVSTEEVEMPRRHEEEEEAVAKQQQAEEKQQEEEWRKEQDRIHEEAMRPEWENGIRYTMQQRAYEKQREEIQKRKLEERKRQYGGGYDSGSSPSSPISSGRPPPQRQGSANASAAGSTWKTAATASSASAMSPSSSAGGSMRSSTSSNTSSSIPVSSTPKPKPSPAASGADSEWARRQAEQAKERQERFRREQEWENQRRAANDVSETLSEKDVDQLYQTQEEKARKQENAKQEEAKRLEEEAKRKEEEASRLEEEVKRKEYNPPPLTPEVKQKEASQAREDHPPPRARRESDVMPGPIRNETGTNDAQFEQKKDPLASLLTILISKGTMDDGIINENLGLVRELLDSSDYDGIISAVRDPLDAKLLIDFTIFLIQNMHLSIKDGNRKARRLMFDLISKTDIPGSLLINDVTPGPDLDTTSGDSECVFRGQHKGRSVTLQSTYKVLHEDMTTADAVNADLSSNNSVTKTYYRNVLTWRSLRHRYILPLLGIFEVKSRFFLVSPLMINGTLTEWRKKQPVPDVAEIHNLMSEVAEGLRHIHSEGIVHGDLYGENILLDSTFRCQISGFGLARHSAATMLSMLNFAAPELFIRSDNCDQTVFDKYYEHYNMRERKTMQTDVYAFGCLYYAIFFDAVPFQEMEQEQIPRLVADGKRPTRLNTLRMDDHVWNIIQNCWSANPSERPTMEQIVQTFTNISISSLLKTLSKLDALGVSLINENTIRRMRKLLDLPEHFVVQGASEGSSNSNIKLLIEFILSLLHQSSLMHCDVQDANQKARKLMLKLVSTDTIPKSLFITDVETDFEPIAVGGFGRVFRGEFKGQKVAIKMLDKGHRRKGSLTQDFCREALAWRSLSHRFILPLLGIFEHKSQLYLVSSFMMNGTLSDWRKEQTPAISELHSMMLEVAEGMLYIHSEGIVHGDLHGGNVLLDSDLHCQITDFGSTRHFETTVTQSTTALFLGFAAPELFGMCIKCSQFDCEGCYEGHKEQHRSKTMKTDIYAFGCLYYSTFFDTVPFHGISEFQIIRLLAKGKRPHRLENPRMEDNTWNVIQRCWESIPSERPTMEQIVEKLIV